MLCHIHRLLSLQIWKARERILLELRTIICHRNLCCTASLLSTPNIVRDRSLGVVQTLICVLCSLVDIRMPARGDN